MMKGVQMLSRKYYRLIAKAIKDNTTEDKSGHNKDILNKNDLIHHLAMDFKADNGLFNYDRFVEACE